MPRLAARLEIDGAGHARRLEFAKDGSHPTAIGMKAIPRFILVLIIVNPANMVNQLFIFPEQCDATLGTQTGDFLERGNQDGVQSFSPDRSRLRRYCKTR